MKHEISFALAAERYPAHLSEVCQKLQASRSLHWDEPPQNLTWSLMTGLGFPYATVRNPYDPEGHLRLHARITPRYLEVMHGLGEEEALRWARTIAAQFRLHGKIGRWEACSSLILCTEELLEMYRQEYQEHVRRWYSEPISRERFLHELDWTECVLMGREKALSLAEEIGVRFR